MPSVISIYLNYIIFSQQIYFFIRNIKILRKENKKRNNFIFYNFLKQAHKMYTGFKPDASINKSVTSGLNETQLQSLQREVDIYTRKLEQEKRKYFSIQDNYKNILEQYEREKAKLNQLKKQNTKAQNFRMQTKIKNLQANLDKAISTYDDTVAHNNKLKGDIDMLRREKKNYLQMHKSLQQQIAKLQSESSEKVELIEKKKKRAQQLKNQIIQIKLKNDQERDNCVKQFDTLEKQYMKEKRQRQNQKVVDRNPKPEPIDTQPLLKNRLKKIIASNRQKIKMIEQYKKHMKMIEEAFNDIKKRSGIQDLNQITSTFIKSEEQNYSLYIYMDMLSQNIDDLEQANSELQRKIANQLKDNQTKTQILSGTPEQEKKKQQLESFVLKKQEKAKQLTDLIDLIKPSLESTLIQLAKSSFNDDPKKLQDYQLNMNINDRTIEQYLSDLEKYINILLIAKNEAKTKIVSNKKEGATTYTRQAPIVNNQEIKDKLEIREQNKFLESEKFRQIASEYWERRKNRVKQ